MPRKPAKKEIHWLWNATIIILAVITIASVFLSFFAIDPKENEKYNDPRIQFNFQLLQFLLLIWMLSAVIIVYKKFFRVS